MDTNIFCRDDERLRLILIRYHHHPGYRSQSGLKTPRIRGLGFRNFHRTCGGWRSRHYRKRAIRSRLSRKGVVSVLCRVGQGATATLTHHILFLNIIPLGDYVRLVHGGSVSLSLLDPPYKEHVRHPSVNRFSKCVSNRIRTPFHQSLSSSPWLP